MKLILCINNQTLEEIIVADPVIDFKNEEEKINRHLDYVKYVTSAMKVKYDKLLKARKWEIYLVAESKMNEKNFIAIDERRAKNKSIWV